MSVFVTFSSFYIKVIVTSTCPDLIATIIDIHDGVDGLCTLSGHPADMLEEEIAGPDEVGLHEQEERIDVHDQEERIEVHEQEVGLHDQEERIEVHDQAKNSMMEPSDNVVCSTDHLLLHAYIANLLVSYEYILSFIRDKK